MAIQYAGGVNVNTTFTCNVGTRREIVDGIVAALTTAGWSTVSGGGTGDVLMQSASTPNSNQIQFRFYDPGAGGCATIYMRNVAGDKVSQAFYMQTSAGRQFIVIANRYQFFLYRTGASTLMDAVMGGVLYVPAFLAASITGDFGWCIGSGQTDGDGWDSHMTFRRTLSCVNQNRTGNGALASTIINGNLLNVPGTNADWYAAPSLVGPFGPAMSSQSNSAGPCRWHDDSYMIADPLLATGLTTTGDEPKVRGQIWDAVIVTGAFTDGAQIPLDGNTFQGITNNNNGYNGAHYRGTLFHVVP